MQGCACVGVAVSFLSPPLPVRLFAVFLRLSFFFNMRAVFSFVFFSGGGGEQSPEVGRGMFFFKSTQPRGDIPKSHLAIRGADQACNLFASACVLHLYPVSSLPGSPTVTC